MIARVAICAEQFTAECGFALEQHHLVSTLGRNTRRFETCGTTSNDDYLPRVVGLSQRRPLEFIADRGIDGTNEPGSAGRRAFPSPAFAGGYAAHDIGASA